MSIGDQWPNLGAMNKEMSFKLLDAFYEAGGNFIDTANNYQNETSEKFLGEWMESRGIRDQIVLATKARLRSSLACRWNHSAYDTLLHQYTANFKMGKQDIKQKTSFVGNSMKSLSLSVEESLKKLRTTYIDILYVHWVSWWPQSLLCLDTADFCAIVGLHDEHRGGHERSSCSRHGRQGALPGALLSRIFAEISTLYDLLKQGISDTPAWIISSANRYARMSGKTPFVVYQGEWSVLERDFERDIIPLARMEGMALAPWGVLAGGRIRTDEEELKRRQTGENGAYLTASAQLPMLAH